jgi:hypothetical protein
MLLFGLVAYTSIEGLRLVRGRAAPSENFLLLGMAVSQAGLLRSLAMLIGIALAGGGLLVSFLTIKEAVELNLNKAAEAVTPSFGLKSTSPGSIAVVLGSATVVAALYATTHVNLNPQTRTASFTESTTPEAPVNTDPLPSIDAIRKQAFSASAAASASTK